MAAPDPDKKYLVLENLLISINSNAIALENELVKRHNVILNRVTENIISIMKKKDPFFAILYKEKFYGGSYYDGLKVENPNEFDLDLILHLPDIIEPCVRCKIPAFVKVEIQKYEKILDKPDVGNLYKLLDGNFLSTSKVLEWIEGLINKSIQDLHKDEKGFFTLVSLDSTNPTEISKIYAKLYKSGPAFTLGLNYLDNSGSKQKLDIDLVPCFEFFGKNWPSESQGYRQNPKKKERFFVVPKKPKGPSFNNMFEINLYWRLSFQEQERELIGGDKKFLKPAIKLLKKLRDKFNHQIASYFIKTVFLWAVLREEPSFWSKSLSVVFMAMLRDYRECLSSGEIPYFWNSRYNLICLVKEVTRTNIANTLQNIIKKIDNNLNDPFANHYLLGKYLTSFEQYEKLKTEVQLSKKQKKQTQSAITQNLLNTPSADTTDSISPLQRLGFDNFLIEYHRQYSNMQDSIQGASDSQISILRSIEGKMDKLLEKVDQLKVATHDANAKIFILEEKIKLLEVENGALKSRMSGENNGEVNPIDEPLFKTM